VASPTTRLLGMVHSRTSSKNPIIRRARRIGRDGHCKTGDGAGDNPLTAPRSPFGSGRRDFSAGDAGASSLISGASTKGGA